MKLIDSIKKDFSSTLTWVLIPVAIAINVVIGQIVATLKLPFYLDSIGTVLVGVLCGPWAGALTGALSNTIWGLIIDPNAFPWWPVALFIGFVAGWCANFGLFKSWWKVAISGFLIAVVAALVSAPVNIFWYGGITASGSSFITAWLLRSGQDMVQAVLTTNILVEPWDKIATAFLAYAIIKGLSVRFLARFPRAENVAPETTENRTQVFVVVVIIAVLSLVAGYFVKKYFAG
jgi:energy-coupling factor transport system substrate-specific component